jgi:hypothetical protein
MNGGVRSGERARVVTYTMPAGFSTYIGPGMTLVGRLLKQNVVFEHYSAIALLRDERGGVDVYAQ